MQVENCLSHLLFLLAFEYEYEYEYEFEFEFEFEFNELTGFELNLEHV